VSPPTRARSLAGGMPDPAPSPSLAATRAPRREPAAGLPRQALPALLRWLERMLGDPARGAIALFVVTLVGYGATLATGELIVDRRVQSEQVHYAYLADAFLHGRLDVDAAAAPELVELVPEGGRHYVVYPPLPAVVLMPFVAVFGPTFPTALASILAAALCAALTWLMLRRLAFDWRVSAATTFLFVFGTGFWYVALRGSSWFFAHVVCLLFLTAALVVVLGERRRPLLVGLLLGAAVLSRLPVVLTVPFFLAMLLRERPRDWRAGGALLAGVGVFVGANMLYNLARYGTVFDVGYVKIPGVLEEPWYAQGIIHWSYLPRNLHALLFQPPLLIEQFPYFVPSLFGLSLFIATPAFLLMFLAPARRAWTWIVAGTALLAMLPGLTHGWPGGGQFGYRFALDAGPFLLILTALGMRHGVTPRVLVLVGLSVLSALWGLAFLTPVAPEWIFPLAGWNALIGRP
jgi:hypothetical protein